MARLVRPRRRDYPVPVPVTRQDAAADAAGANAAGPTGHADDDSALVREFARELAGARRRARGDGERERRALYLLALERERLVDVHYSGKQLGARVARLPAPARVRELIRHALQWASREEQMHAVFVRGALLRQGRVRVALAALGRHLAGLVAGWSSAVLAHASWRRAPLARVAAWMAARAGVLTGRVPRSARRSLAFQSFRDFCRFQVEAERTAEMAWARLEALGGEHAATFARIGAEEVRHGRLFGALVRAFAAGDELAPGLAPEALTGEIAAIDPSFVPAAASAAGRGGRVVVRERPGASADDIVRAAVADSGLIDDLPLPPGGTVAIKTCFMMAYDRRDPSPIVDPALLDALARLLRARGAGDVVVLEAQNHYDHFFAGRGVDQVARYMGIGAASYRVADATADQIPLVAARGHGQGTIAREWAAADLRVSFGKMRTHPSWLAHLSLANLEGLGQRVDQMIFADRLFDLGTGATMVLDTWPCHLALLDATRAVPDGLTGILGCRRPLDPGRLYAARDPLALDLIAARHMGLAEFPRDAPIAVARDWFGDPLPRVDIDGPDAPIAGFRSPHRNDWTILMATLAYPVYAYGSRRGALWVPRMDPAAFPPLGRAGPLVSLGRRLLRALFGFGRPGRRAGQEPS